MLTIPAEDVDTQSATRRVDRGRWWLPAVAAASSAVLLVLVGNALTDDAYITLSYARNLAEHGVWGLIPGELANSATSPLNVMLLGLLTAVTRITGSAHPVLALAALTVLTSAVFGWGLTRLVRAYRLPGYVALLALIGVLANPYLLSSVGLEVLLIPTALVLLVVCAAEGRPVLYGVLSGLTVLIRLDLVLFVLLIAFASASIRRGLGRAVGAAVLVALPWYLFSWLAFGSAVPDTLVIKQLQEEVFGKWNFGNGPALFFQARTVVTLLAFAPAVFGVLALLGWVAARIRALRSPDGPRRHLAPVVALGFGGALHYGVYSLLGVGPYHWYYVTPTVALSVAGAVLAGAWLSSAGSVRRTGRAVPSVALGIVGVVVLGNVAVDVKQGVPWRSPVIFGNWASADDYARVGSELGRRLDGATVSSPGEIGTLAYYCQCRIVDEFSDRGRVVELVEKRIAKSDAFGAALLEFNYRNFDRSRTPAPLDYKLLYDPGPGHGPDTWTVFSAAKGVGHFTLIPASG